MFKRKLKALDYVDWDKVNGNDQQHFRKLVLWLEDQKIRQYKVEDRKELRNITSDQWDQAFEKYCADVACPITTNNLDKLEWLVDCAIRLEYEDDIKKYQNAKSSKAKAKEAVVPDVKSTNPLDKLDFSSNEFKNGVNEMARLLRIPQHPNHLVTLDACNKLIRKRLNESALKNPSSVIVKGKPFPFMETNVGFDTGDKVLNDAGKILTLLYIQDLRDLQTKINEAIVSVQNVTANPKTDTKLGKVGI